VSKLFKTVVFSLLLVVVVFSFAGPVFAVNLETNYPSIPGVGSLEQGQELEDEGERAAFYARYIFRLVFYIVFGVCVAVIIAGGVLYISASAKPVAIVSAKAMIQRALLGLGILVASYLILYTINPQLLVMKFDVEEPGPIDITSAVEADEPGEVEVYYLNPTGIALQTLEGAAEEMYHLSEDGIPVSGTLYYDNYYNPVIAKTRPMVLAPRQGLFARIFNKIRPMPVLASDPPDVAPMIYQAELPLRQTEQIVLEMISIVMGDEKAGIIGLEELLQACKCGQSKHHTK